MIAQFATPQVFGPPSLLVILVHVNSNEKEETEWQSTDK